MPRLFSISVIAFLFACSAGVAQNLYTVTDICAPHTCGASVMNDNAVVAGSFLDGQFNPFLFFPETGLLNLAQTGVSVFQPMYINNSNIVVGEASSIDGQFYCFVYDPSRSELLNLNPVFNWLIGSCNFINDHGDIAGVGFPDNSVAADLVPGLSILELFGITDSGAVLFSTLEHIGVGYWVYLPGAQQATQLSGDYGSAHLFNELAHIVEYPPLSSNPLGNLLLYKPGAGEMPLSLNGGFHLAAINNSDVMVGNMNSIPYLHSVTLGLVPIQSLIPPDTGWSAIYVFSINNGGQILVSAMRDGVQTTILLSPPELQKRDRAQRLAFTGIRSLNGRPVHPSARPLFGPVR